MVKGLKSTIVKSAVAALFVLVLSFASVGAASRVPISFDDYHTFTAVARYLQEVAVAYPDITELEEIGRSNFGRPIYVLIITNRKTGATLESRLGPLFPPASGSNPSAPRPAHSTKPGHWICGSTHGNEYTGTEVCLYSIDQLLSGSESDPEIKTLIDKDVFYICPVVNPDGHFNSLERGISQRANSQWKDDDRDGLVNEDGSDDLDGDGFITQFRYRDPKGRFVLDETEPRLMVRLRDGETTTRPTYSVIGEDRDNDGDGLRGEDPEAGIDINRNYPLRWYRDDGTPGGTGDFPASSPEVKAFVDFFLAHRNILLGQNYHTSGGFTYRPMGSSPHSTLHPKDVAVLDFIMGKKYLELIGEDVPEAWKNPDDLDKFKAALSQSKNKFAAMRGYELPRGWRVSYDELSERQYGFGLSTDWEFRNLGVYSLTAELWNQDKDIPGFPLVPADETGRAKQRAFLKFQDEKYGGKLFVPWRAFTHPELGEGEIGGWKPRYQGNAWPGEPLLHVCDMHWKFEYFRAKLLPEVVVAKTEARILFATDDAREAAQWKGDDITRPKRIKMTGKYRAVEVTARIENKGALATHLAQGATLPGNREDLAWLVGVREKIRFVTGGPVQRLGVLEGAMKIPGYWETPTPPAAGQAAPISGAALPGASGSSREVRWLVIIDGDTPLQVVVSSQKGGAQTVGVDLNPVKK